VYNLSVKEWKVVPCDYNSSLKLAEELDIPKLLAVLLVSRGITEPAQAEAFFRSGLELSDPFLMADMEKAAERILRAIDHFEKIAVYGDYDADGITSTAMLYSYLESCGANVMYYIPEREGEGYGLNLNAIDILHNQEVSLIVTVDNGISSVEEVRYANSLGMEVVITDHHRPREVLPPACAVVDPYRKDCDSPYKDFSGVGVAFKLIMALEGRDCDLTALIENYADLVAIGTIGDIVPLTGENRGFVKAGLKLISRTDRIGLQALIERAGMEGRSLTATNVAFTLVPRINATGRIGSPDRAVRLLTSEFPEEAGELASEICDDNDYRRQIENEIFEKVLEQLSKDPQHLFDRVLVIAGENWHHGVIGIVASKITDLFGKPSIIISFSGGEAKGSGRSVEGFSLFEAICSCEKLLTKFGGHPMAAGITLPTENIDLFRETINRFAAEHFRTMPVQTVKIDYVLRPDELTADLPRSLKTLEPFGMGNPSPLFGIFGATLSDITPVGGGKHLRVSVTKDHYTLRCMKFFTTLEEFPYRIGDVLDLAVTLESKEYNGKNTLSIFIKEIKLSTLKTEEILQGLAVYERFRREEPFTEKEKESLIPNRGEFAAIYRCLQKENGFNGSPEVLLGHLDCPSIGIQKLLFGLDVLAERGLILLDKSKNTYKIQMVSVSQKVNLLDSKVIQALQILVKDGE
jgi:single-stranded-DNA-specific exonuclease